MAALFEEILDPTPRGYGVDLSDSFPVHQCKSEACREHWLHKRLEPANHHLSTQRIQSRGQIFLPRFQRLVGLRQYHKQFAGILGVNRIEAKFAIDRITT